MSDGDGDSDGDANHLRPLPTFECSIIKDQILDIFFNASSKIQGEIAEALVVIAASDFPARWTSVLTSIVALLGDALGAQEFARINTLLVAAGSLFLGFQQQQQKELNYCDIDYCMNGFSDILIEVVDFANGLLNPATATSQLFQCLRLCFQIFHSFNSIHLHDKFKTVFDRWIISFYHILTTSYPTADLNILRAAVCDNLQLFTDVLSTAHLGLGSFVTAVRSLLTAPTPGAQLVVSGLSFLTTVAEGTHSGLLKSPEAMKEVFDSVIMPNLRLRDEDVDLFNGNWIEYVRLDSEVSDTDTPRRAACQLLRVLATNQKEQVVELVSAYIQNMLQACNAGLVDNWKEKDAVLYLVIALRNDLDCTTNWAQVLDSCFTYVISPELLCVVSEPVLKATTVRFLKDFIYQMSKDTVLGLLPHIVSFLMHDSIVVHSYAAIFIERLLLDVDYAPIVSTNPIASQVVRGLSTMLFLSNSYENPYLIKCLSVMLRGVSVDYDTAHAIVRGLVSTLEKMCDRPKYLEFNEYVEVLEALTERFGDRVLYSSFWEVLTRILKEDISEFVPYACRQLGWFVNFSKLFQQQHHTMLLDFLLGSAAWHRPHCVAPCLYLLQMLLPKVAAQHNGLLRILSKFKELLKVSTQKTAVYILSTIVEGVQVHVIEPHLPFACDCLVNRLRTLESDKRAAAKWANSMIYFLSIFIVRHGNTSLENLLKAMKWEEGFLVFIKRYWIHNLKRIKDVRAVNMSAIASILLLRENIYLHDDIRTWAGLLDSCLQHILRTDVQYTGLSEDQLLKDKEPIRFFGTSCGIFSTRFPGRFSFIINLLRKPHRDYLCQLCVHQSINTA